jgi:hypothetical protein
MDPGFGVFFRNRKLKKLLALFLVASVLVVACCAFTTIALVSSLLGVANSMGVFGDGKLSEYIGYASILGSMAGMAGNMVWPGGGIGAGYGTDGFGIGYTTDTYAAAGQVFGATDPGYMENMSAGDRMDLDKAIRANPVDVDKQLILNQKEAAASAAANQTTVTKDVKLSPAEQVKANQAAYLESQKVPGDSIVTSTSIASPTVSSGVTSNQAIAMSAGQGPLSVEYADQWVANNPVQGPAPMSNVGDIFSVASGTKQ